MVKVGERVQFIEGIPCPNVPPILYLADCNGRQVTFNLDGKRFKSQGFRLALIGASGAGKSNLLAVVAEEVQRIGYPFLLFDQEGDMVSLGDLTGVDVWNFNPESDDLGRAYSLANSVLAGAGAVVDVSELSLDAQRLVFVWVAKAFYEVASQVKRRCFFFVDEASDIAPQGRDKDANESRRWLVQIARRGRKRGIYTVVATQRPASLSKDVLAQMPLMMIGRLDIFQDLDAVKPYLMRRVKQTEISLLKSGDFLLNLAGFTEVVRVRLRKTEDLGGTPEA